MSVRLPEAVEVLCCYAHEDEAWLQRLETHLSLLQRQGLISLWHDRRIAPGIEWAKTIDAHLETASVILLLVSPAFLASDYCDSIEMQRALERDAAGEARVVPILVRPVDWKAAPFAHLQVLPTDAKPIVSWQSKDRALVDVTAGIRRVIEDVHLLAASAPRTVLPAIWHIPYPRNPFFLGRDDELAHLRSRLQAGQVTALSQPHAIIGLGGIGKTQLALEYAYRYHQDYQTVLWARAENTEALISSYVAIASLLRLPERVAREQEIIVQAVKTWLQVHQNWLLILDNADELALLLDFLPSSLGGHLLLTTRAAVTGGLARRLEIATLSPDQGALFLLRRAGMVAPDANLSLASPRERELATQISQELGGLPLALDQAGAYLEETETDLAGYWHLYQKHRTDLLRERGRLVADHPEPVATTWSLSFQKVERRSLVAADLLRLCAFLHPDAIPVEIITEGAAYLGSNLGSVMRQRLFLDEAIAVLGAYSLISRDASNNTLRIHRLVQAVLQDQMERAQLRRWKKRAVQAVNAAFPSVEFGSWTECERYLPHALLCASWIEQEGMAFPEAVRLLNQTGLYLAERAQYAEAEPLYRLAFAIQERQSGPEHPDMAASLNNLAGLYMKQGKYEQAELLYQRALLIWERQLGSEHLDMAASLNNLAGLYYAQGQYAKAGPLYQRALAIKEQQLGPRHPDTAVSLNNLAALYDNQGRHAEAEPLYQRALAIKEQQLGPQHPSTAVSLSNLASLYIGQKKYDQAEPLYQRAFAIYEQQLGGDHPDTAVALSNLASLYKDQGRYAEAEVLYLRALAIREQQLGPEHPSTAISLSTLGSLLYQMGRHAEAEQYLRRALEIDRSALGSNHPTVGVRLTNLSLTLSALGSAEEAEQLLLKAEQVLGKRISSFIQEQEES